MFLNPAPLVWSVRSVPWPNWDFCGTSVQSAPHAAQRLRRRARTRNGFVLALLVLRTNRPSTLACAEEPALIRKILTHVQAREKPAGVAARAPPEVGHQESELF